MSTIRDWLTKDLNDVTRASLEEQLGSALYKEAQTKRTKRDVYKENESQFQQFVIDLATLHGYRVHHADRIKTSKGQHMTAIQGDKGFVDLVLSRSDQTLFPELKVPPNKPSDEQIKWLNALTLSGLKVFLWLPKHKQEIEMILKNKIEYQDCVSRWIV